jgi:hypothetical protein
MLSASLLDDVDVPVTPPGESACEDAEKLFDAAVQGMARHVTCPKLKHHGKGGVKFPP